jgi:hypothetical protein
MNCDELLSNFAFKPNLRRYIKGQGANQALLDAVQLARALVRTDEFEPPGVERKFGTVRRFQAASAPTGQGVDGDGSDNDNDIAGAAARIQSGATGAVGGEVDAVSLALARFEAEMLVGPGGLCTPRHRLQCNSINEGHMDDDVASIIRQALNVGAQRGEGAAVARRRQLPALGGSAGGGQLCACARRGGGGDGAPGGGWWREPAA